MSCQNFKAALEAQKDDMFRAIQEDKWYMSEQEGHDVGSQAAKGHFLVEFIQEWATRWRSEWCANRCPCRGDCKERR